MFVAHAGTPDEALSTARSYLSRGQTAGIHERYKCRVRSPWWSVPLPKHGSPDLFLTYCSNRHPRLTLNDANVAAHEHHPWSNGPPATSPPGELAAGFVNSLTSSLLS